MKLFQRLTFLAACLLAAAASAQPSASANAALAPTHARALREIIDVIGLVDEQLDTFRREKIPADREELVRHFYATVTPEKVYQLMIPIYARHVDEKVATALAAAMRPAAVRKTEAYFSATRRGQNPPRPYLSAAEMTQVKAVQTLPATRHLKAQSKAIAADLDRAWGDWYQSHLNHINRRASEALAKGFDDVQAAGLQPGAQEIKLDTVGISHFDKLNRIYISAAIRAGAAERNFDDGVVTLKLGTVLEPVNLVDRAGIDRGKRILDQTDAHLEKYLREIDETQKQCEDALHAIVMPQKEALMAAVDRALLGNYTFILKFGEGQRRILEIHRRYLALAEARLGQLGVEDGRLMFRTDDDVALANALYAELNQAVASAQELAAQRKDSVSKSRKLMLKNT